MNAIIALCHFCDHHGPTAIFCTQAFKYTDEHQTNDPSDELEIELAASSNDQLPSALPTTHTAARPIVPPPAASIERSSSRSSCKACRAFSKGFNHYISYEKAEDEVEGVDSLSRICYISQASPSDPEVFAIVRKACLRTLHCEVFEDPIYFDDDNSGSVIGYEFNIKDCEGIGTGPSNF